MMRPFSEINPGTLRQLRGVVFDVDDTVTRDGTLESVAYEAMWRLADSGLQLFAVTGRPLGWADVLARLWPVVLAVGENGAGWSWRDGLVVREGYFLSAESRRLAVAALEEVRQRVAHEMPQVTVSGDDRARRCDLAFDIGESSRLPAKEVAALQRIIESAGLRCSVSSVHAHAVPGAWDKASGTARAAREVQGVDLEADRDRWLFIGDSGNDAAAFDFFPMSVGVANVRDQLVHMSTQPRWITDGDRGRGFAEMARRVLDARQ